MSAAAVVPGPPYELVAFWPIRDHSLRTDWLIGEAASLLGETAREAGARVAGRPAWYRAPGNRVPGAGAYDEVLVCRVPAVKVERNLDKVRRRLAEATS